MVRQIVGKRLIVTGASSGLGRALAAAAVQAGAKVVLAARSAAVLHELVATWQQNRWPGEAVACPTDVTLAADRERLLATALERWGGVDILVNGAGVGAHGHFVDLTPEILRQIMEVNFFAMAECCRLAIPHLALGQQPLIVNVSSMTGRRGVPAWTEYAASKFAVTGFSESLRPELVRFGIDLLLVVPGLMKTSLGSHLLARKGRVPIPFDKGLAPEVAAYWILRAIKRNWRELWLEREAKLMLWINWLCPWFVDWRLRRLVAQLYADECAEWQQRRRQAAKAAVSCS